MEQMKINVPEGCTAEIKQENGFLIVSFEPKGKEGNEKEKSEEWKPKDGDIVSFGVTGIGIFREYAGGGHSDYAILSDGYIHFNENNWVKENMRPATEEEKQRLFDALAKAGKRWNEEKKCIDDLPRWRAERDGEYYRVCADTTCESLKECGDGVDKAMYECGNYFKTREAAEKVATQIREIFKNSKAE